MDLIVLATGNEGKARELRALLSGIATRIESLRDHPAVTLPPEGDRSYRENALAKARAVHAALGVPALGDDSGLDVDALDGAPGIRSARFAGATATDEANNRKLLEALRGLPAERRTARFRCFLALAGGPEGDIVVEGECRGRIVEAPRGVQGFGYDPLFQPEGETRTYAELPPDVKDTISHRARAAAELRSALARIGA
ncbi:MAG: RdgB/HAM1 family non-canonical purine NTP pyrophosphatase [Hyphomicrobiales bacterium]